MARKKLWDKKEFTGKADLGLGLSRERMGRQVIAFLDENNLAPADYHITWHTETNERDGSQTIIAQVFYRR